MILSVLEKNKINYSLPTFTLDVNQIALKDPSKWPPQMEKLSCLEYNYFVDNKIELCVTPETIEEIKAGNSVENLGLLAYKRFQKSQLFKNRPDGTTLILNDEQPNTLWIGIRNILFPTVTDNDLTLNQKSDVNQILFHTIESGSLINSAFITIDNNFHNHAPELHSELGINIFTPNEAWTRFQPEYNLYIPELNDIETLHDAQYQYFEKLKDEASR